MISVLSPDIKQLYEILSLKHSGMTEIGDPCLTYNP